MQTSPITLRGILSEFLSDETLELFDTTGAEKIFKASITSKAKSKTSNYETLEFHGDGFVNMCVAIYIRKKFPSITATSWSSPLYKILTDNAVGSTFTIRLGLVDNSVFPPNEKDCMIQSIRENKFDPSTRKVLGDLFESFIGAIVVVLSEKFRRGVAYVIVYSLLERLLDDYVHSFLMEKKGTAVPRGFLDPSRVIGELSRTEQFYDIMMWKRGKYEINVAKATGQKRSETPSYNVSCKDGVYRSEVFLNRIHTADGRILDITRGKPNPYGFGETMTEAPNEAAKRANDILGRLTDAQLLEYYGGRGGGGSFGGATSVILGGGVDPATLRLKPHPSPQAPTGLPGTVGPITIPDGFKRVLGLWLRKFGLSKEAVKVVTAPIPLLKLRKCLVHNTYDPNLNYDGLYKQIGVSTIDCVIVEYTISQMHIGNVRESRLSIYKNNARNVEEKKENLPQIMPFEQFVLFVGEEKIPPSGVLETMYTTMLGCLLLLLDEVCGKGVGYAFVYRVVEKYLNFIDISNCSDIITLFTKPSQSKVYRVTESVIETEGRGVIAAASTVVDAVAGVTGTAGVQPPREYEAKVTRLVDGVVIGSARSSSKKEARQDACYEAALTIVKAAGCVIAHRAGKKKRFLYAILDAKTKTPVVTREGNFAEKTRRILLQQYLEKVWGE